MKGSIPWSDTLYLLKQPAKSLAGALDSHFQSGDPDTGQLRHFVVPKLLNVLEEKRLPLIIIEQQQRAVNLLAPRRSIGRMFLGGIEKRDLIAHERLFSTTPPRSDRPTPIGKDAKEPGTKPFWIIAFRQGPIGPNKRVLQRFFSVLSDSEHAYRVTRELCPVPRHEHGICPAVASQDTSHYRGIAVVLNR
jgi:hypothetical protein